MTRSLPSIGTRRRRPALACLAATSAVALTGISLAFAAFSTSASGGPQTLASASLAVPTGLVAANGACVRNRSIEVDLSWTATTSTFADGYEIFRSTVSGGPYASIATVSGRGTTTYTDTGVSFATTYYYVVEATKNAWRSPNSNQAAVTTLNNKCR